MQKSIPGDLLEGRGLGQLELECLSYLLVK